MIGRRHGLDKGTRWVIQDAYREYEGLHWAWTEGHLEGQSGVEKLAKRLASVVGAMGKRHDGRSLWLACGGWRADRRPRTS